MIHNEKFTKFKKERKVIKSISKRDFVSSPKLSENLSLPVSTYLRIGERATRSRRYLLVFRVILKQICRADNQKWIITYMKEQRLTEKSLVH